MLLLRRQVQQPDEHVGQRLSFADGTCARVYRETVIDREPPVAPVVLVVSFRLRRVRSRLGHAAFRAESLLNTVLFAGFPGLISKLWLQHDEHGVYRGVYQWDGAESARGYVRALWWPLALVSVPGSIGYAIVEGVHVASVLLDPRVLNAEAATDAGQWRRLTAVADVPR